MLRKFNILYGAIVLKFVRFHKLPVKAKAGWSTKLFFSILTETILLINYLSK